MSISKFKTWLEFKDIFGFENSPNTPDNAKQDEMPVKRFSIEKFFRYIEKHDLGVKEGRDKFLNEIHWGKGPGAVRCWCGTGLNLMIDKLGNDLTGKEVWYTKRIFQINQAGFGGYEEVVANEVLDELDRIDKIPPDSPKKDYKELESLTSQMADSLRKVARDIFIFEGVKKMSDNHYIIRLSVRGHGVEAQDHKRVEENQTVLSFDKNTGMIRLMNYNIESGVGRGHDWGIMANDTDLYFCPTQPRAEIIETIANTMHWY